MPIGINIADQKKIDHARYRLGAIARHMEQHVISVVKREEFAAEGLVHLANLRAAKALADGEFGAWLKRLALEVK